MRRRYTRPGVSSGAEGFSAIFARGGNLGSNLFTLDGVRIYGFSHLLGLTTAVPSSAISTMDFCLGGFGGETGGLTASHIALHSPVLLDNALGGEVLASNTFIGASVIAPVVKDKAAVMVAGRWAATTRPWRISSTTPMRRQCSLRPPRAGMEPLLHFVEDRPYLPLHRPRESFSGTL